ncbi:YchJ family metal-binding protein, partial [Virgisporangium ochraceum]|uniref:YchJ family metal-binding protein n=1 Tax=Virgisporangium ochraceum TaxID=65505 RepID=UPI0023B25D50
PASPDPASPDPASPDPASPDPASLTPVGRRWTRLRVLATERGGPDDTEGVVEFRAHFRDRGEPGTLTERSRFTKVDGAWTYVDGDVSSQSS